MPDESIAAPALPSRKSLTTVMSRASAKARQPIAPYCDYSDDTAPRIRAYLLSVRPRNCLLEVSSLPSYQRGHSVIERIAATATGIGMPTVNLSARDCADVLSFINVSEPVAPRTWWYDPKESPSHLVGFCFVLQTLEAALRKAVRP